jgi:LysR family glycine cleavage system transcriptional activator
MTAAPRRQCVTITAPTSIAAFWLMPRLVRLQELHPSVDLQLVATNRLCDLAREQIDFAIRCRGAPSDAGVVFSGRQRRVHAPES